MPRRFFISKQPTQKALRLLGTTYNIALEKKNKSPKMFFMCNNPILALSIMKNTEGKHVLKFVPSSEIDKIKDFKQVYGCDEVFLLPCMKCKPCRHDYADDWGVRCTLEAKTHKFNYFVTLTYDDLHISYACKHDFTKFLKNLGYHLTGKPVRPLFFACKERGEQTNRLHFHCVLFLDKPLVLKSPFKMGSFYHYKCDLLDFVWNKGFVDVACFESDCASYVAKYSTKSGSCFMSRNLGKNYYLKNRDEIIKDDFKVYGQFGSRQVVDIPKVFVRWFLEDQVSGIEQYKLDKVHLQRLLVSQQIRSMSVDGESDVLRNKILMFLKKDKYSKERCDL